MVHSSDTPNDTPSHVLLVGGSGDTGRRLARVWTERDVSVVVTTRQSPDELDDEAFASAEIRQWQGAGETAAMASIVDALRGQPDETLVVYNLVGAWLQNPEEAIWGVARTLADALCAVETEVRLVHCSATSVYGDRPGEIVDESSERSPELEVGRIHARAEDRLLEAETKGVRPYVLRLPHIYGPGREQTVEWMAQGEFVVAGDGTNPMHHIYIEDLIEALVSAATAPRPEPPIVNVVDDVAAPYGDYCDFIAESCGHEPLERVALEEAKASGVFTEWLGPHMADDDVLEAFYRYMTSSVEIDNERMKEVLDLDLSHPSYREGLRDLLAHRHDPSDTNSGSPP